MLKIHVEPIDIECPLCEAAPAEGCKGVRNGYVHQERMERADLHEVVETRVPESDVIALHCVECDWEDAS